MGERIGMDISNIIWDRCVNIIENNDYEGCKEQFLKILAMECPFTEEEFNGGNTSELSERSFQAAMELSHAKQSVSRLLHGLSSSRYMRIKAQCMSVSWFQLQMVSAFTTYHAT